MVFVLACKIHRDPNVWYLIISYLENAVVVASLLVSIVSVGLDEDGLNITY